MGYRVVLLLSCVVFLVNSVRIPENPCPGIFSYFKKSENGEIYGESNIPYDGARRLEFSVNASLAGYFEKAELKIQLVTPLQQIVKGPALKYNIFFPFRDVIPKITRLTYNGKVHCSGPPEPLIPGTAGVTNVWTNHIYSFSSVISREKDHLDNTISSTEETGISDEDVPVKDPTADSSLTIDIRKQNLNNNPFLNTNVNSGFIEPPKTAKDEQCGTVNNLLPLIFGGTETEEGQYPWLAALFAYNTNKNIYEYKCTANLVSDKHVVTAARCVQYYKVQVVKTEDILFVFGKNDLSHWATNGAITRGAVKVQVHPYFLENWKSAHGDVAVVTLDKPLKYSKTIRPVCLWGDSAELDPVVNKKGTVAAWGADEKSSLAEQVTVLKARHVEIPIVSQVDCLRQDVLFRNLTSEMTFCAGENGKGPCVGDSGAGFVVPKDNVYYLRGIASIASYSNGNCDLNKYVIFCDVAKFGSWVKSCMKN
ncbi:hypothetical protein NQ318_002027 [Aromia moschata]|uniref:Peptidase S1 domain-containing protein n=1 Tax=Aromia moschata TaxID=1265417 RepID=A0AAV8Z3U3_9CUCU|nr:hypothetical protein NQ318_002027 [Aromia moschata]